jgi:hypothetical protein
VNNVLPFLLIGLLLTSSFVSQVGFASSDFITENKNSQKKNKDIQEFSSGAVLSSSSTTKVCHIPPGNPTNSHLIVVGTSSLTAHLNHGDTKGSCLGNISISEFLSASVETENKTLTEALNFMNNIVAQTTSDSSVGPAVSQAANLHKLFAHEDKGIKKEFQKAFLQFVKDVKMQIGKGNGPEAQQTLNELGKAAIKVKSDIKNEERKNEIKQKIDQAINLKNEKTKLQEIRNEISMLKINYDTDNEEFQDLLDKEQKHLTKVLISEAKANGEKLTKEKINEINNKADEVKEKNNKSNSNSQSDSNNGHGPDKSKNNGSEKSKSNGSDKKSNGKSKGKSK